MRVSDARGAPAPATLKVSMVYRHGYRAVGTVLISGPNVIAKAERLAEMIWHRVGTDFADRRTDFIGFNACWGGAAAAGPEPNEVVFRIGVADSDRGKLQRFAKHLLGFALQGPPGLGIFGGRPDVQEAFGFWPALIPRELVDAVVAVRNNGEQSTSRGADGAAAERPSGTSRRARAGALGRRAAALGTPATGPARHHRLRALGRQGRPCQRRRRRALGRSLRVSARDSDRASACAASSAISSPGSVARYELPNLLAFNFVLHNALGGGGTLSLARRPSGQDARAGAADDGARRARRRAGVGRGLNWHSPATGC